LPIIPYDPILFYYSEDKMDIKTLKNPPIIEALLEIRFNPNKNITLDKLKEFAGTISNKFPKQEPVQNQSFEFMFSPEEGPKHNFEIQPSGFRLKNVSNNRVIIATIDKFVFSFLAPYTSWPELKSEAEKFYKIYLEFAPQIEITRIGMRYVNKVNLPLNDDFQFEKFIKTFPPLPKDSELPDAVVNFETVIILPLEDIGCASTVRQVLHTVENDDINGRVLPFILDIDVYHKNSLKVQEDQRIWELYDHMRIKKNAIFFGTFTDEALVSYE
jgi:uncharacterized protein (TIGR04255 family)